MDCGTQPSLHEQHERALNYVPRDTRRRSDRKNVEYENVLRTLGQTSHITQQDKGEAK
jgi:hypothetical protein